MGVVLWLPFALVLNLTWGWGDTTTPTLGAHVFLVVGTLWLPALGIAGFAVEAGSERFLRAAVLVAIAGVCFVATAGVSARLFPSYPQRGPHELVAVGMVLPAILLPLGAMAFWKRLKVPRVVCAYCGGWAVVLLGATVFVFERDLEMKLPLSVQVRRWERSDIQDFSHYYLRADGVSSEEAARYAADTGLTQRRGSLECDPAPAGQEPGWAPPASDQIWARDDRRFQEDRDRFPDGLAGCFTRMAWAAGSLYVCEVCDWGI